MKLTFYGGAGAVTGANYLFESGNTKILVDCGLEQGGFYCNPHNFDPFPYDLQKIDAIFVTHAHIDHTGRLPKIVKNGFRGKVYSTPPTRDFSEILLEDSEHILLRDADHFGRSPLYDAFDLNRLMLQWEGIKYHVPVTVGDFTITAYDAGHILGSSFYVIESGEEKVVVSGDLGNIPMPMLNPTETITGPKYCLIESAYGNRVHEDLGSRKEMLRDIITETIKNRGTLMIPAFAMERTQELLFELDDLVKQKQIPKAPIFIDSPLAIKITTVYEKYESYLNADTRARIARGDEIFRFSGLTTCLTTEESKAINDVPAPKVIIAGSGMSHGGRILHHERRYLSDPKSALLIIGYQSQGSLGRNILDGVKRGQPFSVKIFGEEVSVRCKVRAIGGYSAHADKNQLLAWLKPMQPTLKKVFVVQGEEDQSVPFASSVQENLKIEAVVPQDKSTAIL